MNRKTACLALAAKCGLFGASKYPASAADAWLAKKEYDKAITDYDEGIRLDPKDAYAYSCRGNAWLEKKEYDNAIRDFNEAISLDPKDAYAYYNVAWLLATCPEEKVRDGKRAIQMATKACELTGWKSGLELDALAAAYAETGQFDEAKRYEIKALDTPSCQGPVGDGFRRRLELYKQKKPFREST